MKAALLLAVLAMPAAAQSTGPADRAVSGSFSADQAERGAKVFQNFCVACHEPTFHVGEQFLFSWSGRSLFDYFRRMKATMPEDNPAGLPDDDYVRVMAYILKLNGYKPGTDSLRSDTLALKRIRIGDPRESAGSGSP